MKLCRFNGDRLGLVEGEFVLDVTPALDVLPSVRWPVPAGDLLIAHIDEVIAAALRLRGRAPRMQVTEVQFDAPVANPTKLIAAPVNYLKHQAEANADGGKNFDKDVKTIEHYGLFLKSNASLVGPSRGVDVKFADRRTDHEIELVVIIGRGGRDIPRADALEHVAGYSLGLDMTIRGSEDRSLRKSMDTFSVVGPWLVTRDEVADPNALQMRLEVNGDVRQHASTADLIFNVEHLIEYASKFYTLYPGDVIFTGTPEGVGPVKPGDVMYCSIESVGAMNVRVIGG